MTKPKKSKSGPTIERDPDNKNTLILDRWPTRAEKAKYAEDARKARTAKS